MASNGNGIGVTFIPSAQNQQTNGPGQGSREGDLSGGGSSDLGTAWKILGLALPKTVSAAAPAPQSLLTGAGAAGLKGLGMPGVPAMPGGSPVSAGGDAGGGGGSYDPYSAVFEALLKALSGGGMGSPTPSVSMGSTAADVPPMSVPRPSVAFGTPGTGRGDLPSGGDQPAADPAPMSPVYGGAFQDPFGPY